jgi:hypothetical protein
MDVAAWAVTWPGRARPNRGPVMPRPAARERREMAKWTVLGRARASRVRPGFAIRECVADGKLDFVGQSPGPGRAFPVGGPIMWPGLPSVSGLCWTVLWPGRGGPGQGPAVPGPAVRGHAVGGMHKRVFMVTEWGFFRGGAGPCDLTRARACRVPENVGLVCLR